MASTSELTSIWRLVTSNRYQDPVVQSIVSLTISLRHKFVKQISAKVTNTLLFFVEKNVRILCSSAKDSHIFSTKNNKYTVTFFQQKITNTLLFFVEKM